MTNLAIDQKNVSWERLSGEVIAIQLSTGHYYSMGGTSADIWSLLAQGSNLETIIQILSSSYSLPVEAQIQIQHFLDNATAVGLLTVVEGVTPTIEINLPDDYIRTKWVEPKLQEYTDLQDLILVDPVHDTKATGWPDLNEE